MTVIIITVQQTKYKQLLPSLEKIASCNQGPTRHYMAFPISFKNQNQAWQDGNLSKGRSCEERLLYFPPHIIVTAK